MDTTPKHGDYVRVEFEGNDGPYKLVGLYHDEFGSTEDDCLVDFKMKDTNEYSIVLTVCPIEKCEFITKEEFFLWKLQGHGVGLYDE